MIISINSLNDDWNMQYHIRDIASVKFKIVPNYHSWKLNQMKRLELKGIVLFQFSIKCLK